MRGTMDHYGYLPEKQAAAVDLLDALDTWRDWADGKAFRHDHLNNAIDTLGGTQYRPLTDVVEQWANGHQIELLHRPVVQSNET